MQELSFIIDIKKSGDSCKYFEGTKKYIATADIIDDEIVSYTEVTYTNKPSRANVIAKPGDVIFAKMQNTIKVIVVDEETSNYIYSTGFYCIQDDRYLPEFLKCYFMSKAFNEKKDKNCNGATMKALSDEGFKKIKLPLITKEVQKQIIDEYLAISSSIKNKNKQIAIFDELIKSQFIEMFGVIKTNKFNFPMKKMIEVCNKITDGKHGGCKIVENSDYYFVGAREIYDDNINYESAQCINKEEFEKDYQRCNVELNDFLIVNTGATIGKSAIVKDSRFSRTLLQKSVALLKPKHNIISPYFLKYMYLINEELYKVENSSAQPNLLLSRIKNSDIYLPPKSLQDQFAAIVEQIDKSKYILQKQIDALQELLDSKMEEFFG